MVKRVGAQHVATRYGIARVLSKRGICSRSEAERRVIAGRVRINGRLITDPEYPLPLDFDGIEMDGIRVEAAVHRYVMLNKPRGLVTTAKDDRGRDTVYRCFDGANLEWIAPVGRLDKASEGLLLFSSDSAWAAAVTSASGGPLKAYHVQVDALPDDALLASLHTGVEEGGDRLKVVSARVLRHGERNAWLEIVLDEGRNRHIRRLLACFDIAVLRLVRVGIGALRLGELPKGGWRELSAGEVAALVPVAPG